MICNNYNEVESYIHCTVSRLKKELPELSFDLQIHGMTASITILDTETNRYIGRSVSLEEIRYAIMNPLPLIVHNMLAEL